MEITDNKGRRFNFEINIGTISRCEKNLGVNLCRLLDSEDGIASLNDPLRVCEYIYHTSDAPARGIAFDDFGSGFFGDVLGDAVKAFNEELTRFFHNPRKRIIIQKIAAMMTQAEEKIVQQLDQSVAAVGS